MFALFAWPADLDASASTTLKVDRTVVTSGAAIDLLHSDSF